MTLISDKRIAVDHFPLIPPQDSTSTSTSSSASSSTSSDSRSDNYKNKKETWIIPVESSSNSQINRTNGDISLITDNDRNLITHKIKVLSDFDINENHLIQQNNFEERIESFNLYEKQKNLDFQVREEKLIFLEEQMSNKENSIIERKTHRNPETFDIRTE